MSRIHGVLIDARGRCAHYGGARDVVANRCATCSGFFACHRCHDELADHPFGQMSTDAPDSVLCGACGHVMGYHVYSQASACPACDHLFNPGCFLHAPLYFEV